MTKPTQFDRADDWPPNASVVRTIIPSSRIRRIAKFWALRTTVNLAVLATLAFGTLPQSGRVLAQADTPVAYRLGSVYKYKTGYSAQSAATKTDASTGRKESVSSRTDVDAVMDLAAIGQTEEDGILFQVTVPEIHIRMTVPGQEPVDQADPGDTLAAPFFVERRRDGSFRHVIVPIGKDDPQAGVDAVEGFDLRRGLVTNLQIITQGGGGMPRPGSYSVKEIGSGGAYTATYQLDVRGDETHVTKHVGDEDYSRLADGSPIGRDIELSSDIEAVLSSGGVVLSASYRDTLANVSSLEPVKDSPSPTIGMSVTGEGSAALEGIETPGDLPSLPRGNIDDQMKGLVRLYGPMRLTDLFAEHPERPDYVTDGDPKAIDTALQTLAKDATEPAAAFALLSAIRSDRRGPSLVKQRLGRGDLSSDVRIAIASVLASVGDAQSQDILLTEYVNRPRAPIAERSQALLAIAQSAEPSKAAFEAVTGLRSDANLGPQSVLARGAMAHSIAATDPEQADAIAASIESSLAAAGTLDAMERELIALGNAGRLRSLSVIEGYLDDDSPRIKYAAYGALRKIPGDRAGALLLARHEHGGDAEKGVIESVLAQRQADRLDSLQQSQAIGELLALYWSESYPNSTSNIYGTVKAEIRADGAPLAFLAEGSASAYAFGTSKEFAAARVMGEPDPVGGTFTVSAYFKLGNNVLLQEQATISCGNTFGNATPKTYQVNFINVNTSVDLWGVLSISFTAHVGGYLAFFYGGEYQLCDPVENFVKVTATPTFEIYADASLSAQVLAVRGGITLDGHFLDTTVTSWVKATISNSKLEICYDTYVQIYGATITLSGWYQVWWFGWGSVHSGTLGTWGTGALNFTPPLLNDCKTLFVRAARDGLIRWTAWGIVTIDSQGQLVQQYLQNGWCKKIVPLPQGVTLERGSLLTGEPTGPNARVYAVTTAGDIVVLTFPGGQPSVAAIVAPALHKALPGTLAFSKSQGLYYVTTQRELYWVSLSNASPVAVDTWGRKISRYSLEGSETSLGSSVRGIGLGNAAGGDVIFTTWLNNGVATYAQLGPDLGPTVKVNAGSLASTGNSTFFTTKSGDLHRVYYDTSMTTPIWKHVPIATWGADLTYSVIPGGDPNDNAHIYGVAKDGGLWNTYFDQTDGTIKFGIIDPAADLMPDSLVVGMGPGVTGVKDDGSLVRAEWNGTGWATTTIYSGGHKAIGYSLDSPGTLSSTSQIVGLTTTPSKPFRLLRIANTPTFALLAPPCPIIGWPSHATSTIVSPVGMAQIDVLGEILRVTGLGSTGEDGVHLSTDPARSLSMTADGLRFPREHASLALHVDSDGGDTGARRLGGAVLRSVGGDLAVKADFRPSGARAVRFEIWSIPSTGNGSRVGAVDLGHGALGTIRGLPRFTALSTHSDEPEGISLALRTAEPFTVDLTSGQAWTGNELRLLLIGPGGLAAPRTEGEADSPMAANGLTGLEITGAGLSDFSLSNPIVDAIKLDPPTPTATPVPTVTPTPIVTPAFGTLSNISTRAYVGTGDDVMIGGFIIRGGQVKIIVRALGPSLAANGVPKPLLDPNLRLFSGQTVIAANDNWETGNCKAEAPEGLWPKDPREACLVITLSAGPFTAIVDGVGATTGIALVEAFHSGGSGELSNISTRAHVGTGDDVTIGGFITRSKPLKAIVRGIGPSLSAAGIPNPLQNPHIRLFSGQTVIAENDDWETGNCKTEAPPGLWPKDPREACLVITLPVGPYTAIDDGVGGTSGVSLVEVFNAGP